MRVDRIVCIQTQHCMAVTSSEIATAVLELRSAALTLIAVVLKTTDLDALAHELEHWLQIYLVNKSSVKLF